MGTPVTFVSKRKELRIIVKPADRTFDEARRPVILRGERVEFFNHRFTTDDDKLTEWLVGHPLYGLEFTSGDIKLAKDKIAGAVQAVKDSDNPAIVPTMPTDKAYVSEAAVAEEKQGISRSEIDSIIDKKMDDLFNKISGMFQGQAAAPKEPHQKRVFTCPVEGCGQTFKTGIDVGRHKKSAHGM